MQGHASDTRDIPVGSAFLQQCDVNKNPRMHCACTVAVNVNVFHPYLPLYVQPEITGQLPGLLTSLP